MSSRIALGLLLIAAGVQGADTPRLPPGPFEPLLRVDSGGPTGLVTALAFSPDGNTLYAGGYDKVVRTWRHNAGRFTAQPQLTFRIPLELGRGGAINALAVSPDGQWLAVGGLAPRRSRDPRQGGVLLPGGGLVDDVVRRDEGLIYLFKANDPNSVQLLRGHRGPVVALTFAQAKTTKPLLVSLGYEDDKRSGEVYVWEGAEAHATIKPLAVPLAASDYAGLAAWTAGDPPSLRVAVSVPGRPLLLWDGAAAAKAAPSTGISLNDSVLAVEAARPGQRLLVRGGWKAELGVGSLESWGVDDDGRSLSEPREAALQDGRIRSLAVCANRLAILTRQESGKGEEQVNTYRLRLTDLRGEGGDGVDLWNGRLPVKPLVAATPRGRFLAVAGFPDHGIRVFGVQELLKGQAEPQVLLGEGEPRTHVAFVRKGTAKGLRLGGLLFDFAANRLADGLKGWEADGADLAGWDVHQERDKAKALRLSVSHNNTLRGTVVLPANQLMQHHALLPSGPQSQPLLAVSSYDGGIPILSLFQVSTGVELRRLVGHQDRIGALAFSSDGRFLASASDDQTVCLWSLTDLPQLLGVQGMIRGLVVADDADTKKVTVVRLLPGLSEANRKALTEKDVIEEVGSENRLTPVRTAEEFLRRVRDARPGTTLTARTGKGVVVLAVDQGADFRRPLLSLFVTREREWIGWAPQGAYDLSSREAESRIGWHKNTGRESNPVEYHRAADYRREFYRRGLLPQLFKAAQFVAAPVEDPGLRVAFVAGVSNADPSELPGVKLVRDVTPQIQVAVDQLEADRIEALEWRLGKDDWKSFAERDGRRRAELPALPWPRGEHVLQVRLRTREETPREITQPIRLYYLPPPPTVTLARATLDRHEKLTRQARLPIEAVIRPQDGKGARVQLYAGDTPLGAAVDLTKERPNFSKTVPLREGWNRFRLEVENVNADERFPNREKVSTPIHVEYRRPAEPEILIASVSDALENGDRPSDGTRVLLGGTTTTLTGTVRSDEELRSVTLKQGEKDTQLALDKGGLTCTIDRALELSKAGEHTVQVSATTINGGTHTVALTLDARPLPGVKLTAAGKLKGLPADQKDLEVKGELDGPLLKDQRLELRHNDKVVPHHLEGQTLTATVSLSPGDNTVRATTLLRDKKDTSPELTAYVLRPPVVRHLRYPARAGRSKEIVEAEVLSPLELKEALLDGQKAEIGKPRREGDPWRLKWEGVPIAEERRNEFQLRVANPDGIAEETIGIQGRARLTVGVRIEGSERLPEVKEQPVVRRGTPQLLVEVQGADAKQPQLQWTLKGPGAEEWQDILPVGDAPPRWRSPLRGLKRGPHTITVRVRDGDREETVRQSLLVLPAAPALKLDDGTEELRGRTIRKQEVKLGFQVKPGVGEEVDVELLHEGKPIRLEADAKDPTRYTPTLPLVKEVNRITIRARNRNADTFKKLETVEQVLVLTYKPAAVPEIVVRSVSGAVERGDRPGEGETVVIAGTQPTMEGLIRADDELESARMTLDNDKAIPLPLKRGEKELAFKRELELPKSGEYTVRVVAKTVTGGTRDFVLKLDCRPLPTVKLTAAGKLKALPARQKDLEVEGELSGPLLAEQRLELRHGDTLILHQLKGRTFTARVPLAPGHNTIQAVTTLRGLKEPSPVLTAYVLRPPFLQSVEYPSGAERERATVTAEVMSALELTPPNAQLLDDKDNPVVTAKIVPPSKPGAPWQVTWKDVPIPDARDTRLVVRVGNSDGDDKQTIVLRGRPKVTVKPRLEGSERLDELRDKAVIRAGVARLVVDVEARGLADPRLTPEWSFAGIKKEWRRLKWLSEKRWGADIAGLTRGAHQVVVRVGTTEADPRTVEAPQPLDVYVLPAPPSLSLDEVTRGLRGRTVRQRELPLTLTVRSEDRAGTVLTLLHNNLETRLTPQGDAGSRSTARVSLKEGRNSFVVRAVNKGADKALAPHETTQQVFEIHHQPVPAPDVTLNEVNGAPARIGQTIHVTAGEFRLRGTLRSEEELSVATLTVGAGKPLALVKEKAAGEHPFDLPVTLSEPGAYDLTFLAKTPNSEERKVIWKLEYRPPLPRFTAVAPRDGDRLRPRDSIRLEGELSPPARPGVTLSVRRGRDEFRPTLNNAGSSLSAEVTLKPGINVLEVIATEGGRRQPSQLKVYVLRPPVIKNVSVTPQGDGRTFDLEATVESPAELALTEVGLTNRLSKSRLDALDRDCRGTTWTIRRQGIALVPGVLNTFDLRAVNGDDATAEAFTVKGPPVPVEPPTVRLESPPRDLAVSKSPFEVRFSVHAQAALTSIRVLHNGVVVQTYQKAHDLAEVRAVPLELKPGANQVQVVATNQGGEGRSEQRVLTYIPDLVRVHFQRLQWKGGEVKPEALGGEMVFARSGAATPTLVGELEWIDRRPDLAAELLVRVRVNGFELAPVELSPAEPMSLRRRFELPLRLNQTEDNLVEVRVGRFEELGFRELKVYPNPATVRVVSCPEALTEQHLHIVAFGTELTSEQLGEKIRKTFQLQELTPLDTRKTFARSHSFLTRGAFKQGRLHLLSRDAVDSNVMETLEMAREDLNKGRNEVVVFYFAGDAEFNEAGRLLMHTSNSKILNEPRAAVKLDEVQKLLDGSTAAQLLLLDLDQEKPEKIVASPLPLFQYAWYKGDKRPNQPKRLLDVLDETLRNGPTLKEADQAFHEQRKENLLFQRFLPAGLGQLRLTKK